MHRQHYIRYVKKSVERESNDGRGESLSRWFRSRFALRHHGGSSTFAFDTLLNMCAVKQVSRYLRPLQNLRDIDFLATCSHPGNRFVFVRCTGRCSIAVERFVSAEQFAVEWFQHGHHLLC